MVFDTPRSVQFMPRSQNHLQLRVLSTVHRHRMLRPGDIAGIAVSGGADSVALLRLMSDLQSKLGIRIMIVHFNHQLRGSESDADELFVKDLARQKNLDFIGGTEDVGVWAREHACNLEDAARKCRHRFFSELIREGRITRICVGHTADDQAETVLAKIIRGTGPAGLGGIFPVAELVIRPLIEIRRAELREYLTGQSQTWREDSTNFDESRLRARIRARLLPQLEQDFQPAIVSHLNKLSELAREDDEFWSAVVEERFAALAQKKEGALSLPIDDLLRPTNLASIGIGFPKKALTTRLIRRVLEEIKGDRSGFTSRHVEDILHLATICVSGHQVNLPGGIIVERSFNNLLFSRKDRTRGQDSPEQALEPVEFQYALSLESLDGQDVVLPEIGTRIRLKLIDWPAVQRDTRHDAFIANWKLLRAPTVVRSWLPGDAFRPQGGKRNRKLKHLMREKRIAPRDRRGWPVLTSAGEIVWARGFPVAQEFGAAKDTRKVLAISEEPL
jgi:tRNA(Ile)-lysidine synthase